eukprot:14538207-Alexandrium_andersonii.AAC.1
MFDVYDVECPVPHATMASDGKGAVQSDNSMNDMVQHDVEFGNGKTYHTGEVEQHSTVYGSNIGD